MKLNNEYNTNAESEETDDFLSKHHIKLLVYSENQKTLEINRRYNQPPPRPIQHDSDLKPDDLQDLDEKSPNTKPFSKEGDIVNHTIDKIGMSNYQLKILLFGIFMCFCYGSEIVVVSLIVRKLEKIWLLSSMKKALLGGGIFYGFLIGALFCGKVMDTKGRRYSFILGCAIFSVFGALSAYSYEFYSFMLFRIGVGVGIGFTIPTTLAFITEMSPRKYRGFNNIFISIGFPLGEMYMCFIAKLFPLDSQKDHDSNWTIVLLFASFPIIINILLLTIIHESPRYHLMNNEFDQGFAILNFLRQDGGIPELSERSKSSARADFITKKNLKDIEDQKFEVGKLLSKEYFKLSLKLWVIFFLSSYIFFGVLYLIPELIGKTVENVNFHDLIRAVVFSTVFETIGILCSFMIEVKSIGRLGTLKIGFILSFIFSSLCLVKWNNKPLFLFILKGSNVVSTRALFIYAAEIYPTRIRGLALGYANVITKLGGILAPIVCQVLLSFSFNICFLFMSSLCLLGLVLTVTFEVETLNLNIE